MTVDLTRIVTPLRWPDGGPQCLSAGNYDIWLQNDGYQLEYISTSLGVPHITLKAAIAAANADHAARVLAALDAELLGKLVEALKSARETIVDLIHARGSEVEGTDEEWVGDIDAILAKLAVTP